MEKEIAKIETQNTDTPILLDVETAKDSEIKDLIERTPEGLFLNLVGITWQDYVKRELHQDLDNPEVLRQKKAQSFKELFDVELPNLEDEENLDQRVIEFLQNKGRIVYIPSSKRCIWYAPQEIHEAVLTSPHKGIISKEEQEALKDDVSVIIAGVSVGASVTKALAKLGVGNITAYDPKEISLYHLSRIDTLATNIGRNKAEAIKEDLLTLNPYANWNFKGEEFNSENTDNLWEKDTPLKILVDVIDNPDEKLKIRKLALEEKAIVLMVTDIGNGRIILDYDDFRFSNTKAFGGRLDLQNKRDIEKWEKMENSKKVANIIGIQNLNRDMINALPNILKGKYASFPQIGLTSQIAGGVVANTLLNLVRGINIKQRSVIDINKVNHKRFNYFAREGIGKYLSLLKNVKYLKK